MVFCARMIEDVISTQVLGLSTREWNNDEITNSADCTTSTMVCRTISMLGTVCRQHNSSWDLQQHLLVLLDYQGNGNRDFFKLCTLHILKKYCSGPEFWPLISISGCLDKFCMLLAAGIGFFEKCDLVWGVGLLPGRVQTYHTDVALFVRIR